MTVDDRDVAEGRQQRLVSATGGGGVASIVSTSSPVSASVWALSLAVSPRTRPPSKGTSGPPGGKVMKLDRDSRFDSWRPLAGGRARLAEHPCWRLDGRFCLAQRSGVVDAAAPDRHRRARQLPRLLRRERVATSLRTPASARGSG